MKSDVTLKQRSNAKVVAKVGVLAAVAAVLMALEFPLWFAPAFYELDFSEVPILLATFSLGPAAGAMTELVKILINLVLRGTDTAGVGEFANFLIGCSLIVPAGIIYKRNKTFKNAIFGLIVGTLTLAVVGALLNYYMLLP